LCRFLPGFGDAQGAVRRKPNGYPEEFAFLEIGSDRAMLKNIKQEKSCLLQPCVF
jgi:hypothetical protein